MTTPESPAPARRTGLIIGASVAAVLVIAALTTASVIALTHHSKPTSAAAAAVTTPAPAVTTAATASVSQYASAVSPQIKSLRTSYAQYQADACAVRTDDSGGLACALMPLTFKTLADTLSIVLQGSAKPSAGMYIGDPPPEIAKLVDDTEAAAGTVVTGAGDGTTVDRVAFSFELSALMSVLDRWDPYM